MATRTKREMFIAQQKEAQAGVELYRGRFNDVTSHLYQLLTYYTVFQGVVFNVVATTKNLTCQTSLLPVLLSLLASIATVFGVHWKLKFYKVEKLKFIKQEQIAGDMMDKINGFEGDEENFDNTVTLNHEMLREKIDIEKKTHRQIYTSVMLFLVVFSMLIMACCVITLCWDQNKGTMLLCAFNRCLESPFTVHVRKA